MQDNDKTCKETKQEERRKRGLEKCSRFLAKAGEEKTENTSPITEATTSKMRRRGQDTLESSLANVKDRRLIPFIKPKPGKTNKKRG